MEQPENSAVLACVDGKVCDKTRGCVDQGCWSQMCRSLPCMHQIYRDNAVGTFGLADHFKVYEAMTPDQRAGLRGKLGPVLQEPRVQRLMGVVRAMNAAGGAVVRGATGLDTSGLSRVAVQVADLFYAMYALPVAILRSAGDLTGNQLKKVKGFEVMSEDRLKDRAEQLFDDFRSRVARELVGSLGQLLRDNNAGLRLMLLAKGLGALAGFTEPVVLMILQIEKDDDFVASMAGYVRDRCPKDPANQRALAAKIMNAI